MHIGVSRKSPAPIQPTGADRPAPLLQPTDEADAGDRSAKGILMPVQCDQRSWKSETDTCRTEWIPICISFSTSVDSFPLETFSFGGKSRVDKGVLR